MTDVIREHKILSQIHGETYKEEVVRKMAKEAEEIKEECHEHE